MSLLDQIVSLGVKGGVMAEGLWAGSPVKDSSMFCIQCTGGINHFNFSYTHIKLIVDYLISICC